MMNRRCLALLVCFCLLAFSWGDDENENKHEHEQEVGDLPIQKTSQTPPIALPVSQLPTQVSHIASVGTVTASLPLSEPSLPHISSHNLNQSNSVIETGPGSSSLDNDSTTDGGGTDNKVSTNDSESSVASMAPATVASGRTHEELSIRNNGTGNIARSTTAAANVSMGSANVSMGKVPGEEPRGDSSISSPVGTTVIPTASSRPAETTDSVTGTGVTSTNSTSNATTPALVGPGSTQEANVETTAEIEGTASPTTTTSKTATTIITTTTSKMKTTSAPPKTSIASTTRSTTTATTPTTNPTTIVLAPAGSIQDPSILDIGDDNKDMPSSASPHGIKTDPLVITVISVFVIMIGILALVGFLRYRQRNNRTEFRRLQDLPMDDMMEDTPLSLYSY